MLSDVYFVFTQEIALCRISSLLERRKSQVEQYLVNLTIVVSIWHYFLLKILDHQELKCELCCIIVVYCWCYSQFIAYSTSVVKCSNIILFLKATPADKILVEYNTGLCLDCFYSISDWPTSWCFCTIHFCAYWTRQNPSTFSSHEWVIFVYCTEFNASSLFMHCSM